MDPCHIAPHISFQSISLSVSSYKMFIFDLLHSGLLSRILNEHLSSNVYHKCRTFRTRCTRCTFIIIQCTYYDALLYVIFSSFHYILKFMAKYFLHRTLNMWHLYCEGVVSHKTASNTTSEIFSHTHTQLYTGWFVICGHYCRIWAIFSVVMVHNVL